MDFFETFGPDDARELTLAAFVARSQAVARWINDARAAFPNTHGVPADQFQEAVLWLAATGVVPVVVPDGGAAPKRPFVPNFAPDRIVVSTDEAAVETRRTAGYRASGADEDARVTPVECWIAPVVGDHTLYFMTPVAALHREVADAERRYRAVEEAAAWRLNAPLMFARDPTGGTPVGASPADVLAPRRRRGPYAPYSPGHAPAGIHRLFHGATYRDVRDNLLRPYDALPPFDDVHARGIARVLTLVLARLGFAATVRPRPVAPAPPAPAKRARPPDDSDSDNES